MITIQLKRDFVKTIIEALQKEMEEHEHAKYVNIDIELSSGKLPTISWTD